MIGIRKADPVAQEKIFYQRLIKDGLITKNWLGRTLHPNGRDHKITLGQVWELYKKDHLPSVTESTRLMKIFRCSRFYPPLFEVRLCEMTPQLISEFVRFQVENLHERVKVKPSIRSNFDKEIKDLKALLNWHRDTVDFQYANPVKDHHYKLGVIRQIPQRQRQISREQFQSFLSCLPAFYQDLVVIQFFCASRIGETAGLQWKNVDFANRILTIREILVWPAGQPRVKGSPKNGQARHVFLNDTMLEIFKRRLNESNGSEFVFHRDGLPLLYSVINANFNRAWKKANLEMFRGTHQVRYFSAQQARILTGSIDGVKAVTGHQSIVLAQKYSDYTCIDQNRSSVEKMEAVLHEMRATA